MRPDSYDHDKISTAYSLLSANVRPVQALNFATVQGRGDGLPYCSIEREEPIPESVSFSDYLPHNISKSPMKKAFSHT